MGVRGRPGNPSPVKRDRAKERTSSQRGFDRGGGFQGWGVDGGGELFVSRRKDRRDGQRRNERGKSEYYGGFPRHTHTERKLKTRVWKVSLVQGDASFYSGASSRIDLAMAIFVKHSFLKRNSDHG